MSLSKLSETCQVCPFRDTCDHKMMESVGYLQPSSESLSAPLEMPIARETRTVIVNGQRETVYLDEIEKELYKHLYKSLYAQFGA